MSRFLFFFLVFLGLSFDAFAQVQGSYDEIPDELMKVYNDSVDEKKGSSKKIVKLLTEFVEQNPDHVIGRARLGAAYVMLARDSFIFSRMGIAKQGLVHLDKAVEIAGSNFMVMMISARVHIKLPSLLSRQEEAYKQTLIVDEIFFKQPRSENAKSVLPLYVYLVEKAKSEKNQDDLKKWSEKEKLVREMVEEESSAN